MNTQNPNNLKNPQPGKVNEPVVFPESVSDVVSIDPAGAYFMTYQEQIKSPQWQKKRLEVLDSRNFTCEFCSRDAKTLNVHHVIYDSKRKLWDYDFNELIVLCEDCHKNWHSEVNDLLTQIAYLKTNCNPDFMAYT